MHSVAQVPNHAHYIHKYDQGVHSKGTQCASTIPNRTLSKVQRRPKWELMCKQNPKSKLVTAKRTGRNSVSFYLRPSNNAQKGRFVHKRSSYYHWPKKVDKVLHTHLSSDPLAIKRPQGETAIPHGWQRLTCPSKRRSHLQ